MADYKIIPEQIRAFLAASDGGGSRGWSIEIAELAEPYGALVNDANQRLRRCAEYLRRGMRSEAVHLAQCQPRLLELAESLRLPDPLRWARACTSHGLPAPPELLADGLDSIGRSFDNERELEPLLARHRLLALAQAPVKDRLEVLRALASRDPGCAAWDEGLRLLETARFSEIRSEAKVAYKAIDQPSLERLADELRRPGYRSAVPDDLREGLDNALNAIRLEAVRKKLVPLLARLEAARRTNDLDTASKLLDQWQELVDTARVVLPHELSQRVRPVVNWIADQQRRRLASEKLAAIQPVLERGQQEWTSRRHADLFRWAAIIVGGVAGIAALLYTVLKLTVLRR